MFTWIQICRIKLEVGRSGSIGQGTVFRSRAAVHVDPHSEPPYTDLFAPWLSVWGRTDQTAHVWLPHWKLEGSSEWLTWWSRNKELFRQVHGKLEEAGIPEIKKWLEKPESLLFVEVEVFLLLRLFLGKLDVCANVKTLLFWTSLLHVYARHDGIIQFFHAHLNNGLNFNLIK